MVLWDLLPVGLDEVKQVEVARGPGSAIWGANALTGAINIITKSPREMLGTRATVGIGERDTREAAISHAAESGRVAYRLSGSYYSQARWDRPPTTPDGTPLPPYESLGTTQNKADVRVDFDQSDRAKWRFDAGFASSNGLIIVAPGPYDANPMRQTYGSAEYTRGSASFAAMTSTHSAQYAGLLTTDGASISSQSLQLDARDNRVVAGRHLLVYGASYKHSHFDLSFVPDVHDRDEGGAFITDDLHLTDTVRSLPEHGWTGSTRSGCSPRRDSESATNRPRGRRSARPTIAPTPRPRRSRVTQTSRRRSTFHSVRRRFRCRSPRSAVWTSARKRSMRSRLDTTVSSAAV